LKDSRLNLIELNDLLEQFPDYKYQGHRCDEANVNKRIVKGDYKIMLQEDDILSIEFVTHFSQVGEQSTRTVYHSLVMNPKEFNENKYSLDPESLFSNFDRKVLKKHVENFNKGTQLDDPKGLLKGTGNSIRHITVDNFAEFPEKYIKGLLKQAYRLSIDSLENKEQKIKGQSIIKSVSATKKRPS